jgi:AcrR family transcriptional regulator
MRARADAAAATGERILDAAVAVFWEGPVDEVPLEEVARRAGVSVQTIIRRFGGKEGLFAAAADRETDRVRLQRGQALVGDVRGAVLNLVNHYEEFGVRVLRLLAEEDRSPALRALADQGRVYHAAWCERVFAPALAGLRGAQRARRLAQLITICDVLTWKLLRHDRQLSRGQTELAMIELLEPLTGGG